MKHNIWNYFFLILAVLDYGVVLMIMSYAYGGKIGAAILLYTAMIALYGAAVRVWKDLFLRKH